MLSSYFYFPETNGYKLEAMDAIFETAHEKGENPVKTERKHRKGKDTIDVEKHEHDNKPGGSDSEPEGAVRGMEEEKDEIKEDIDSRE